MMEISLLVSVLAHIGHIMTEKFTMANADTMFGVMEMEASSGSWWILLGFPSL